MFSSLLNWTFCNVKYNLTGTGFEIDFELHKLKLFANKFRCVWFCRSEGEVPCGYTGILCLPMRPDISECQSMFSQTELELDTNWMTSLWRFPGCYCVVKSDWLILFSSLGCLGDDICPVVHCTSRVYTWASKAGCLSFCQTSSFISITIFVYFNFDHKLHP